MNTKIEKFKHTIAEIQNKKLKIKCPIDIVMISDMMGIDLETIDTIEWQKMPYNLLKSIKVNFKKYDKETLFRELLNAPERVIKTMKKEEISEFKKWKKQNAKRIQREQIFEA